MNARFFSVMLAALFILTTLVFAQQTGAQIWFSPQQATIYKVTKTYLMSPVTYDPLMPQLNPLITVTTNYTINPPLKFHADTGSQEIMFYDVRLIYDSQKLTIEPGAVSSVVMDLPLTALSNQPGNILVAGASALGGGAANSPDKSLFRIDLPVQSVPEEPVIIQGTVERFMLEPFSYVYEQASASTTVKALAKSYAETVIFGDENGDGNIDINDALIAHRELALSIVPDGTVLPYNLGDVNLDGTVNVVDALLAAQKSAGMTLQAANYNVFLADVDFNDRVDVIDALLIINYSLGKMANF